jgi:hypothetical protein
VVQSEDFKPLTPEETEAYITHAEAFRKLQYETAQQNIYRRLAEVHLYSGGPALSQSAWDALRSIAGQVRKQHTAPSSKEG